MRVASGGAATLCAAAVMALGACGGGSAPPSALSDAPSEVIEALKAPDNPYRIIYSPPVDLAKRPAPAAR